MENGKLANQIARLETKMVKHRIDEAQQHLLLACNTETSTCHFDNVFYFKKKKTTYSRAEAKKYTARLLNLHNL